MRRSPIIHELQPISKPAGRQLKATKSQWARVVATITNPNLLAVVAICTIGLLLTLNFILRFPDFGAVIEQYNKF
jgi:hypothetical protein